MVDLAVGTDAAILDAALVEVLEHGIRRTSATDIARRAGVSRQTLYRHWPDLQTLLAALVTRELLAALPRGAAVATTCDELVGLLVDTAGAIAELPLLARLRSTDPELLARYILQRLGTSQHAIHAELVGRIEAGQAAGFVRAGAPAQLAAMVLLIAQSAIQSAPLVAGWLDEGAWRRELDHALHGYLQARP
ncbi:helix-turn-helix domain-containing protein [Microbacterium kribbense]